MNTPSRGRILVLNDLDEAASACEAVLSDPERQGAAALQIAREYFGYDVVLTSLLDRLHLP
jgi:hypothetical protein